MKASRFFHKKTSFNLNIRKVGKASYSRSTPDKETIGLIILGFLASIGLTAYSAHKSERANDLVHKVVDKTLSKTDKPSRPVTLSRNGKLHDYVEVEADNSVREPN